MLCSHGSGKSPVAWRACGKGHLDDGLASVCFPRDAAAVVVISLPRFGGRFTETMTSILLFREGGLAV